MWVIAGLGSLDKLFHADQSKKEASVILKSIGLSADAHTVTGLSALGRSKLVQFILLARLALRDPNLYAPFEKYLDQETVEMVLKEIATWPTDRKTFFVTQLY